MGKNKRKPREKTSGISFLKPVDFSKVGTNDDPCFGKLYKLSTKECSMCGDSELCAVVFAQHMNKERKKIEKTNKFKDLDLLEENKSLVNWVKQKHKEGLTRAEVIKTARKTFGSQRDEIKKIYKKWIY